MNRVTHQPRRITWRTKITLILAGTVLFFTGLELSMRTAGSVIRGIQQYRNRRAAEQGGAYRILCFGESTTAVLQPHLSCWPTELQILLDLEAGPGKFAVFNEGRAGARVAELASQLSSWLDQYRPHLVIAMIGINDHVGTRERVPPAQRRSLLANLRTYKLIKLLIKRFNVTYGKSAAALSEQHGSPTLGRFPLGGLLKLGTQTRANAKDDLPESPPDPEFPDSYEAWMEVAHAAQARLDFTKAVEVYEKLIYLYPKRCDAYLVLAEYYAGIENNEMSEQLYRRIIELQPTEIRGYQELGMFYIRRYHRQPLEHRATSDFLQKAEKVLLQGLELDPQNPNILQFLSRCYEIIDPLQAVDYAKRLVAVKTDVFSLTRLAQLYELLGEQQQAENYYKRAIEFDPHIDFSYRSLATHYYNRGMQEQAEAILGKAHEVRMNYFNENLRAVYHAIHAAVKDHRSQLVMMQYPLNDVRELQVYFNDVDDVLYISNQESFQRALQLMPYDQLFVDRFGGNFGHTTRLGNIIIATEVAHTVLRYFGFTPSNSLAVPY